jgi:hypothetical protein
MTARVTGPRITVTIAAGVTAVAGSQRPQGPVTAARAAGWPSRTRG